MVWDSSKWERLHSFSPDRDWNRDCAPISSVCLRTTRRMNQDFICVLIGTRSNEIFEMEKPYGDAAPSTSQEIRPLVQGHHRDELWGLATHPFKRQFCTVGDDCTLRLWDIVRRGELCRASLPCMARACDFWPGPDEDDETFSSPEDKEKARAKCVVAVGFGGSVGKGRQKQDGQVRIYVFDETGAPDGSMKLSDKPPVERHHAHEWISDVKFSPNGKVLAVGSHDNSIYIYKVDSFFDKEDEGLLVFKLDRPKVFNKHSSYITHFDFSTDNRYLQSNCGAYELLFCDVQTGRQETSATKLRDRRTQWATWTCTLGWPVQGIWPPCADGTDINAVARASTQDLVATADDFGKVKLFRYPCTEKGSNCLEFRGHSSHVTNIRWSAFDECLISTGGNDQCTFQWRHVMLDREDPNVSNEVDVPTPEEIKALIPQVPNTEAVELAAIDGEQRLRQMLAPTTHSPTNTEAPSAKVVLERVLGYRSSDCRSNAFYSCEDKSTDRTIVYHAAAVGVIEHYQDPALSSRNSTSPIQEPEGSNQVRQHLFPMLQATVVTAHVALSCRAEIVH